MALARRRIGRHSIVYDQATSLRLARFGHETSEPERIVRRLLSAFGLRFRIRNRDLPGSPDAANRSKKWAVFVHGCYWHHHRGCPRATVPSRNRSFWLDKFADNRRRDRRVVSRLRTAGFRVAVIWECEVTNVRVAVRRLADFVRAAEGTPRALRLPVENRRKHAGRGLSAGHRWPAKRR